MCQDCRNKADYEKQKKWAEKHPEKKKERSRQYELRNNDTRKQRWHNDPAHRQRNIEAASRYRDKNRDEINRKNRERWKRIREAVIAKYGGCCSCCGETAFEFLAIDHVNGCGLKARKLTEYPTRLYRQLLTREIDNSYRILCHNCNMSFGFYGYCPHKKPLRDPGYAALAPQSKASSE